jgi:hypothetical protein
MEKKCKSFSFREEGLQHLHYNRYTLVFSPVVERLDIVECDLEKPNQIGPALGNASVLLCCIGAGEKEVFDVTGPYRIDYLATKNLVDAGKKDIGLCDSLKRFVLEK